MSIHKIVDITTGEETLVNYTKKELDEQKAIQAEIDAYLAAQAEKVSAKAAVLEKLNLTEEELKAILG
jgi:hypothetical protein